MSIGVVKNMLLSLGRFIIDCQYLGLFRCEAPVLGEEKFVHWDWKPANCKDCFQCRSYLELPEARITNIAKGTDEGSK